jgi:magnesium chelatase subunit I
MSENPQVPLMPYTQIVGQDRLKMALEIAYISPGLGGVLIRGQRGTGKSTAARAFGRMMYGELPVTLPINATEDRVVGGWDVEKLIVGEFKSENWRDGLLKQANQRMLFIDEVNLLDDHIINLILDVVSTGVLSVQREGKDIRGERVTMLMVGTMNPDEGELRPQLLDRFGLSLHLITVTNEAGMEGVRAQIIRNVLAFDVALSQARALPKGRDLFSVPYFAEGYAQDDKVRDTLQTAQERFKRMIHTPDNVIDRAVQVAQIFGADGHRADYLLVLAAKAWAAHQGRDTVSNDDVNKVAPLVLAHRKPGTEKITWDAQDDTLLAQ